MHSIFDAKEDEGVSESRFHMWRAVFAMAHADNFIALEEQGMLYDYLDSLPLTKEQLHMLREDVATPQNAEDMFLHVTDTADIEKFFEIAHALVWCDGDFSKEEKDVMGRMEEMAASRGYKTPAQDDGKTGLLRDLHKTFESGGMKAVLNKMVPGENQ